MKIRGRWLLAGLLVALLSACNLAGDVTPPPGASPAQSGPAVAEGTAAPVSLAPPPTRPDPAAGAEIYVERCAACHGVTGGGDGAQAADLAVAPAALADPAVAGPATPQSWYQIVTEGRMDRFMPPFTSLSDRERWDVVAYALSLSMPPNEELASLYERECAQCHGGVGEGADGGPSLVELADFVTRSREEIAAAIRDGQGVGMPAYAEELNEEEIEGMAAQVQRLGFSGANMIEAAAAELESEEPSDGTGVIDGQVINESSGDPVGGDLEVTLHAFDGQQQVLTEQTEVNQRGRFNFPSIELVPGRLFVVSTMYQGVRYTSEVGHVTDPEEPANLPLAVFDVTAEADSVVARRIHILVDRPTEDTLRIVELWILVNEGSTTVAPVDGQGGVEIALPAGSTNLRFEDSLLAERYQPTERGFRLVSPLRPGGEGAQVVFSFDLPLERDVELVQALTIPVEAGTVLVSEGGPRVEGEGLTDAGQREAGGEQFHQYDLASLRAGETLRLGLQGPPWWQQLLPGDLDARWAIGAVVFVLALAGIGWWYRPWIAGQTGGRDLEAGEPEVEARRHSLLKAIADLDEAFEAGEVEETVYQHRRQELKAELMDLLERSRD